MLEGRQRPISSAGSWPWTTPGADLAEWRRLERSTRIGLRTPWWASMSKLHDAYLSVAEALAHGGYGNGAAVQIGGSTGERHAENAQRLLALLDGIIIPGGFGSWGSGHDRRRAGRRQRRIPALASAWACRWRWFGTGWVSPTPLHRVRPDTRHPVIDLMPDQQKGNLPKGGTMQPGPILARWRPTRCFCRLRPGPHRRAPPPPLRVQRELRETF